MKVALIAGSYSSSSDGIGRYVSNLANELLHVDKTLALDIIPPRKEKTTFATKQRSRSSSLPAFMKRTLNAAAIEWAYYNRFINNTNALATVLQNTKADIYHAISPSESVAAIQLDKKPLITTVHDIIPLVSHNRFLLEKTYFKQYLNAAKKSDLIIADSQSTKQDLVRIANFPEEKIRVVYPGIDTEKFYPGKKVKDKKKIILYLGGLVKRKGIYETIHAFHHLLKTQPDVQLHIGGGGPEEPSVKTLVSQLSIQNNVTFLGFINEENMLDTYHSADLFVYPSHYEGFGYTPLEAMAAGIPVITSNVSSLPEVVGNAAITVDPTNIEEIAHQMERVLSNESLQKEMKELGIMQANTFTKDRCAKETYAVYKQLL